MSYQSRSYVFCLLMMAATTFLATAPAVTAAPDQALLDNRAPDKPMGPTAPPAVDPATIRQGGDTIDDAFVIDALPFTTAGTTVGYNYDYDQQCPYWGLAPDVCYLYTATHDMLLRVDLCGSAYDTKTYIYGPNWEEVACNDDYYLDETCGVYVSLIENAALEAGVTYLICVDGYGSIAGDYLIDISEDLPCDLIIPSGAVPEGEPPLVDDYVDNHNSGCGGEPAVFQQLVGDDFGELTFAGIGGWYLFDGNNYRDTDWFTAVIGETGVLEVEFSAESHSCFFELAPTDCAELSVVGSWESEDCEPVMAEVVGEPGAVVWLFVSSTSFWPPGDWFGNEYDYLLEISGLAPPVVATDIESWSGIKAQYR